LGPDERNSPNVLEKSGRIADNSALGTLISASQRRDGGFWLWKNATDEHRKPALATAALRPDCRVVFGPGLWLIFYRPFGVTDLP
jgi:hypothetical protein